MKSLSERAMVGRVFKSSFERFKLTPVLVPELRLVLILTSLIFSEALARSRSSLKLSPKIKVMLSTVTVFSPPAAMLMV